MPFTRQIHYDDVWVKRNRNWKLVSSLTTRITADTTQEKKIIKQLISERKVARLNGNKTVGKIFLDRTYTSISEIGDVSYRSESFNTPNDTAKLRRIAETNKEVQLKAYVDSFHFKFYDNTAIVKYRLYIDLVFNG